MNLKNIGFYTLSNERALHASETSQLWRCELLLTDKCNFKCPYCRGSNEFTKGTLTFEEASHVVDLWASHKLKNIRFSGGEPTVVPYLVDLVKYTKAQGIERIAISSNGSAKPELYKELVEVGVNDFSISLDACCATTGDMMAGVKNSWIIVKDNIEMLSKLTYVTVGVVLTDDNFNELKDIIEFSSGLGVSDIRILSSAQWNNEQKFRELFDNQEILTKYPILNYRISNFKNGRNVRGIKSSDSSKCRLMLDDMIIAGQSHFSCVIAMREGIEPIGSIIGKTMEQIRQERKEWVESHNTHDCSICKNNCLDVCVDFNNVASKVT